MSGILYKWPRKSKGNFLSRLSAKFFVIRDNEFTYHSKRPTSDQLLSTSKQQLADRQAAHLTQTRIEYGALFVFLAIAITATSLAVMPLDSKQKYTGCGLLVIVAIMNAIVMNYVKQRSFKEGFTDSYLTSSTAYASNNVIAAAKDEALIYLDNTLLLANILQTYRVYGNVNESMGKELDYYQEASEQLDNVNTKVQSVYTSGYLADVKFSALVNLLISLSLIVSGTTAAYVFASQKESTTGGTYALYFGAFLAVISIAIYILELNSRVHTDPRQYHWGKPSTKF
jgi:hypothetical protein